MYDIHDAPVFQLTFDLLKDYHLLRLKFPKTEKYTLGERIEDQLLAALIQITEAGRAKKEYKITPIDQAIAKTETAVILFRLANEMKLVMGKQYVDIQERLHRAGQMLGGWRRSC